MTSEITEKEKYTRIWELDAYRERSPGLRALKALDRLGFDFVNHVFESGARTLIDIGCGSGKMSDYLMRHYGDRLDVYGFDIAENCLDKDSLPARKTGYLTVGDLTDPGVFSGREWDASFCCDVLEHVPTEDVSGVLANIRAATSGIAFLGIALFPDHGEQFTGEILHLTVKPPSWWEQEIEEAGFRILWARKVARREAESLPPPNPFLQRAWRAAREGRLMTVVGKRIRQAMNRITGQEGHYFVIVERR